VKVLVGVGGITPVGVGGTCVAVGGTGVLVDAHGTLPHGLGVGYVGSVGL